MLRIGVGIFAFPVMGSKVTVSLDGGTLLQENGDAILQETTDLLLIDGT